MNEGSTHPQLSELCLKHLWMFDCCRNKFPRNALQCQSSLHCSASHQPTTYKHCSIKLINLFIGKEELERKSTGRWRQWAASKVSKPKWGGSHGNLARGEDSHVNSNCHTEVADRRSRDLPERKLWSQLQFMRWEEKNSSKTSLQPQLNNKQNGKTSWAYLEWRCYMSKLFSGKKFLTKVDSQFPLFPSHISYIQKVKVDCTCLQL